MRTVSKISDEELAGFLASTPPRRYIPPAIRNAALRQVAPLFLAVFGAFFGGFGLIFVSHFTPWNILEDLRLQNAPTVSGLVETAAPTRMSINHAAVMQFSFSFQPPSSGKLTGKCYATGNRWKPGDRVSVRYLHDNPTISRIEGGRRSPSEASGFITWIFPAVGFALVITCLRNRKKVAFILQHGRLIEGTVSEVSRTNTRVNKQVSYKITFQRPAAEPLVLYRHQSSLVAFARQRLESKQPVFLLQDPTNPKKVLFPESF